MRIQSGLKKMMMNLSHDEKGNSLHIVHTSRHGHLMDGYRRDRHLTRTRNEEELLTTSYGLSHGSSTHDPPVVDYVLLVSSRAIVWICSRRDAWYCKTP